MNVILSSENIVELYCICRQAERSVHRALGWHWEAFRAYYGAERQTYLEAWERKLVDLVGPGSQWHSFANRDALVAQVRKPGFFRVIFGAWFANRRRTWSFSPAEIAFAARVLYSLIDVIGQALRPADQHLIDLRMDLWACEYLLDCRCHGLSRLERARHVEHFMQTASVPHEALHEICGSSVAVAAMNRRKTA
jgi:hypothetical protein